MENNENKPTQPVTTAPATTQPVAAPVPPAATSEDDGGMSAMALDERALLMQRARIMGIQFSNNIGTDTLKERIQQKMAEAESSKAVSQANIQSQQVAAAVAAIPPQMAENAPPPEIKLSPEAALRKKVYDEAMKLVRIRITNMDPKKKDLPGEILTVANEYIGTVRKFVPFGEASEQGYHVPQCIYDMMKDRKFQNIRTIRRNGKEVIETSWAPEFALEVLPPLTKEELERLAASQMAADNT